LWADTLAAGGEAGLGAADVEEVLRLLQETVQRTLAQGIGIVDEDDIGDDEDED
jgi:para-aminobenzoate synthetase